MWKRLFSVVAVSLMVLALLSPICHSASEGEETTGTPAGWSDEINLSETTQNHQEAAIATFQDNVHVVWRYNPGPTRDVLYRKSTDGGKTWNQNLTLGSSSFFLTLPDISLYEENIHVVWEDDDGWVGIYYRNSTDNGETWNPTRRISPDGMNTYTPQIYVNTSNIHIIWYDVRDGSEGEIYYRRSLDGGSSWDNGQGADEDRRITYSPATISGIQMAGDGSNISIAWADEREGDWEIYWMISKDNGLTWEDGLGTPNVGRKISDSVDDSIGRSIAVDDSNIHIVWYEEHWPGPEYRLYYRNSTDNGATWNTPQLLTGPVPGINSPDIDVESNNVSIVWDDERDDGDHEEIYYISSTDGGITWSADLRLTYNLSTSSKWPRIAIENDAEHIVWYTHFGGALRDVFYKRYPDFPADPTHNITLDEGWNLVSLPLEQPDESIDQALSSIAGQWDCIRTYNAITGTWESNSTYAPNQLNDLSTLNHKQGFWINITEPGGTTLTVSGPIPTSTSIDLYAGWNLVGYPSLVNETVANALWGTGADTVMVCDTSEPYHIREVDPMYLMTPGEGYWVHVPFDTVWIVDW